MNKREAIAALRELADKLEAMPIDGEALFINGHLHFHDVSAEEYSTIKPLVPNGGPRDLHSGCWAWGESRMPAHTFDVNIFGPKEVICP